MKKVLTLALAVLAVAAAQAVTITWTFSVTGPKNDAGKAGPGWLGAIALAGDVDSFNGKDVLSWGSESGANYTISESVSTLEKVAFATNTYYKDFGNNENTNISFTTNFDLPVGTDTITFYFFNKHHLKSDNSAGGYMFVTVTGITDNMKTIDLSGETVVWSTSEGKSYTMAAVPEPTALALLALGVAGLALKRKHA